MTAVKIKLKKQESGAILQSLESGVVPKLGLRHIVVGRQDEIKQVLTEIQNVKEGAGGFKVVAGDYGSGKTFMLRYVRGLAIDAKFVVADADFSNDRRLAGDGYSIALYRELMKNLATPSRPENALESIVERWLITIEEKVVADRGLPAVDYDDAEFVKAVQTSVNAALTEMQELVGGYAFRDVLKAYYRGHAEGNEDLRRAAIRWLRGEYTTKTDARRDLGVREIVTDENWFEHLELLASFAVKAGYSGMALFFDEAVNLYKFSHTVSRQRNYEALLRIYNTLNQGGTGSIYVMMGATVKSVFDDRRGLFSYEALKSRLAANAYETTQFRDFSQPVIQLFPLSPEHLLGLLLKLRDIHHFHNDVKNRCADEEVQAFLQEILSRPGAKQNITAREVVRRFLDALNILNQNPKMPRDQVFKQFTAKERSAEDLELEKAESEMPLSDEAPAATTAADSRFQRIS